MGESTTWELFMRQVEQNAVPRPMELDLSPHGAAAVEQMMASVGGRASIPVRHGFVRRDAPQADPPVLARLVESRATVAIKLYLAIIWRCAAAPYEVTAPARDWAWLLDLDDPTGKGARRIRDALTTLEQANLIHVTRPRGEIPTITLLREDGTGQPYTVPWREVRRAQRRGTPSGSRYFQLPLQLWTSGHLQHMSGAALAMLLLISEETRGSTTPQWWSVTTFSDRFAIKKDTRATGTKELSDRHLITVRKQAVASTPGTPSLFNKTTRTRNTYQLINQASPKAD